MVLDNVDVNAGGDTEPPSIGETAGHTHTLRHASRWF